MVTKFDEGLYLGRFLYAVGANVDGTKFVTIGGTGLSVPVVTDQDVTDVIDYYESDAVTVENGVLYVYLDEMPFDHDGRHATGRAYWDGIRWWNEYDERG